MKFRLVEDTEKITNDKNILNETRGQTSLKELIVNTVEDSLNISLDSDNYCVHHLYGEHTNNRVDEVSITTKGNHARITNYIRSGNMSGLEDALSKCYVIKAYGQALAPVDITHIMNKFKQRYKYMEDPKTGVRWRVFSYDIWNLADPIKNPKGVAVTPMEFNNKEELNLFTKNFKRVNI